MDIQFVPLVVVGGLGGDDVAKPTVLPLETVDFGQRVQSNAALARVSAELAERSRDAAPWIEPAKPSSPVLRLAFANSAQIYAKSSPPSILSPKNPESLLYPDGLFTTEWVRKYREFWPSTALVFYEFTNQTDLAGLGAEIGALKARLAKQDVRLVAVVTATAAVAPADLETAVAELRWASGLAPRTGMLMLPPDSTDVEIGVFVETLWQLLGANAADFFASRAREVRHKRDRLVADANTLRWDARYTMKLAAFAEFKYDVRGALRLYESAYDCVRQLFDNGLGPERAAAWCAAREMLDVIAIKIAKHALYLRDPAMASKKYRYHQRSVTQLLKARGVSPTPMWLARSYHNLAELVALATLPPPAGAFYGAGIAALPRAGLLFFDAARCATEPAVEGDPYQVAPIDAGAAFVAAFGDLRGFPRTAGVCLQAQAEYLLTQGDRAAAVAALEKALPLLHPAWPHRAAVARQILDLSSDGVQQAAARLALLSAGEIADATPSASDASTTVELGRVDGALFDVEGTFAAAMGYLGRPVLSQITLRPKFVGRLKLATIKVIFTGSSVSLEHSDASPDSDVFTGAPNLEFTGGRPKTFEISMPVTEIGEVAIESVHIIGANPVFVQECRVTSATAWLSSPVGPITTRHLRLASPREIEVLSRKPHVTFTFDTPGRVAPEERAPCLVSVVNHETEPAHVRLQVFIDEDGLAEQQVFETECSIDAGAESEHQFVYPAPPQGFTLRAVATYTTDSDPLPVKASDIVAIDVASLLRTTFDLVPRFDPEPWPSPFLPATLPEVARAWLLQVALLPLSDETQLHDVLVAFESEDAAITVAPHEPFKSPLHHNETKRFSFTFTSRRQGRDLRTFDGRAKITMLWSRVGSPDVVNETVLPALRLSLTHQEPRVLLLARRDRDIVVAEYYLENSTAHTLTFAVSMGTSPDFSIQGPKGASVRLLPFSRRHLRFELVPLKTPPGPLPELRVFDTAYKRALPVLCGDSSVVKQASGLFLAPSVAAPADH